MMASALGEDEDYSDAVGVVAALERTCELEGKLRQAIQDTHPLTTTLDWDFEAADREREALLGISEQLEYLEDKLREYRFLEDNDEEHKAVVLSQLDNVRRELIEVVEHHSRHIMFGKEVVREVYAFACVSDQDGSADQQQEEQHQPQPAAHDSQEEVQQAAPAHILRSSFSNRPPRYPTDGPGSRQPANKQEQLTLTPNRSGRLPSSSPQPVYGGGGKAAGDRPRRSVSYDQSAWGNASPGARTVSSDQPSNASPGPAATTIAALSAATATAADAAGTRRRQINLDPSGRQAVAGEAAEHYGRRQAEAETQGRTGYLAGVRASAAESGRAVAGARAAGAAQGGRILSRMDRRPYNAGPSGTRGFNSADIFGAVSNGGRPASIYNPSPRQFGGMVRIRDMLARAEEGGGADQQPAVPQRPRIYTDSVVDDASEWDAEEGSMRAPSPRPSTRSLALSSPAQPRHRSIIRPDEPIDEVTLWKGPNRLEPRPTGSYRGQDESRRRPGLLGRLSRVVLTGAVVAGVAVAAKHAGPVVAEKAAVHGRQVMKQLQDVQQSVAAAARERRAKHEQQRKARAAAAAQQQREQLLKQQQEQQQQAELARARAAAAAPAKQAPAQRAPAQQEPAPRRAAGASAATPQPGKGAQIADMPPWLENGGAGAGNKQRLPGHPATAQHGAALRDRNNRMPPGAAAATAKKAAERQAGRHAAGRQGPVQHVQAPPRSDGFPSRPAPDISVSMG